MDEPCALCSVTLILYWVNGRRLESVASVAVTACSSVVLLSPGGTSCTAVTTSTALRLSKSIELVEFHVKASEFLVLDETVSPDTAAEENQAVCDD